MKRIIFTVTNDLNYDRRMIRICSSLSRAGYRVLLVGVSRRNSLPLEIKPYGQKRIPLLFHKGFAFYAEYNFRLFWYLLFRKKDILCCIDVDTMLPVRFAAGLTGKTMVYDAHEYFSQQKEIVTRPGVHKVWHWIERNWIPKYKNGYTVCDAIADEFKKLYKVDYAVIRNLPLLDKSDGEAEKKQRTIIYRGAVNEGRGFTALLLAMEKIDAKLVIYGDGNFMKQTKELIDLNNLRDKVLLKGMLLPEALEAATGEAYIGASLIENDGLNQYYSLPNKFFDYINHKIPQVTMNYPELKKLNDEFGVALLIDEVTVENIAASINQLLNDENLYMRLQQNCLKARTILNWQEEEKKLLAFYERL